MRSKLGWQPLVTGVMGAKAFGVAVLTAISILNGSTTSVQAAQTVVLRRGSVTETIELADLKTLAATGTVPPKLQDVARILTPEQRRQVQAALQAKFGIDAIAARNFLNTEFGNNLSSALASITPRQDTASVQSVRLGLILGARAPEGLSLLSFIEAYPSDRLDIDLDRAFQVAGNFNASFWQTQAFMAAIAPRLAARRSQINIPFDPTQPGNATVEVLNLNLIDRERRREIPVDVYWSTQVSPAKPIVVFSHGLGSVRTDMRYLAEHLASHGYVVAALEHPGSNEAHVKQALQLKAPLLEAEEFLDRPKDISFVLDLLQRLYIEAGPFRGRFAPDRAMVVGYSLGGATALSIAGAEMQLTQLKQRCPGNVLAFSLGENAQCFAKTLPEDRYQLRDPRIKAAIAFSPTTSLLFGETGLSKVAVPTLIASGSADKTAPALTEQIVAFDKMPSPKWLVGFVGGTHLSVKDPSTTQEQASQPDTLYSGGEIVGEQAVEVRNYVKAIALAMAAQLTNEATKNAIFLTPEYAQLASTERFPIRLITEIPPEAEAIVQEFVQNPAK
jgi:predicted dienelactone hydrolase